MAQVPAPIQLEASGDFLGIDGPWSAFSINVGSKRESVQVLPSTLTSEAWVIPPDGCTAKSPFNNCVDLRGGTFDNSTSDSWKLIKDGLAYSLGVEGNQLGSTADNLGGEYGYDTIVITDITNAGISIQKQVIAQITATQYFVGSLGLNKNTPSIGGQTEPGLLKTLYDEKKIPSLSYSYTAGAQSRNDDASLTFGGQDTSKFEPNNVNFTMSTNEERDLTVGLQAVAVVNGGKTTSLLTDGILSFIDSTLPYIWIPVDDCGKWEDAFGLKFNDLTTNYEISQDQHEKNLDAKPEVTFTLGQTVMGGDTTKITLPYEALALNYTDPTANPPKEVYYFPLRQARSNNQFVLGRAFLQNAYLSVNYEWSNFSVSQTTSSGGDPHIVALPAWTEEGDSPAATAGSPASPSQSSISVVAQNSGGGGGGFPKGAIAGIVVAVVAVAIGIFVFCCLKKRKQKKRDIVPDQMPETPMDRAELQNREMTYAPATTKAPPANDYFSQQPVMPTTAGKGQAKSNATELPSPPAIYGGIPSPAVSVPSHFHAAELPGSETNVAELGVAVKGTMSQGPSPNLSPQPVVRAGASPEPWAPGPSNAYEPHSPQPSVLSAQSMQLSSTNNARMVTHSRGGTSPHGSGLGPMTPTVLGPDHEGYHDADGVRRVGSHRSHNSEGTLVDGPSPAITATNLDGPVEGGLSAFTSPVMTGYAGTRGDIERQERERMVSPEPLDPQTPPLHRG